MKKIFYAATGLRPVWKILGFLALCGVLGALAILGPAYLHRRPSPVLQEWLLALAVYVAAWICVRLERRSFASLGFSPLPRFVAELLGGSVLGLVLIGATATIVWLARGVLFEAAPGAPALVAARDGLLYLSVAALEEGLFRGYAFQRVLAARGERRGLLIFAAVFAVAHLGNPNLHGGMMLIALANIFLAGLLLGLCYVRTSRLGLPIGVHLGWDWGQAMLGFAESGTSTHGLLVPVMQGRPDWLTGGPFGLEASVPSMVVLALTIAVFARRRAALPTNSCDPDPGAE